MGVGVVIVGADTSTGGETVVVVVETGAGTVMFGDDVAVSIECSTAAAGTGEDPATRPVVTEAMLAATPTRSEPRGIAGAAAMTACAIGVAANCPTAVDRGLDAAETVAAVAEVDEVDAESVWVNNRRTPIRRATGIPNAAPSASRLEESACWSEVLARCTRERALSSLMPIRSATSS